MNSNSQGPVTRIHAEFRGDEALEIDTLEIMLRMDEVSRTRIESDTRLVRLALKALQRMITRCGNETGRRYPSYVFLRRYLDEEVGGARPGSTRLAKLQERSAGSMDDRE